MRQMPHVVLSGLLLVTGLGLLVAEIAPAPPALGADASAAKQIELQASTAKLRGGIKLGSDGSIMKWDHKSDSVEWNFTSPAAGWYEVQVTYSTSPETKKGGTFVVTVAAQSLTAHAVGTKGWKKFETESIGKLQLSAGALTLGVQGTEFSNSLMNLKAVTLTPTDAPPAPVAPPATPVAPPIKPAPKTAGTNKDPSPAPKPLENPTPKKEVNSSPDPAAAPTMRPADKPTVSPKPRPAPAPPADPALQSLAKRLAKELAVSQQKRLSLDPETTGPVTLTVSQVRRTADGAQIMLSSHQDVPLQQDFKSINGSIAITLKSLPGELWECTEAKSRIDGISTSHGPANDGPSPWQNISRDVGKALDKVMAKDGKVGPADGPSANPVAQPAVSVATPPGSNSPPARVGLKLMGMWEAQLVVDDAKLERARAAKKNDPILRDLKKNPGAMHFAMEFQGNGDLYISDFTKFFADTAIAHWHYEGEQGNAVSITQFGRTGPRKETLTLQNDDHFVVDLPELQNSVFQTPTVFARVGPPNVIVGYIDTTRSLRDLAVDWIAHANALGPKDKLVDDMENVVDRHMALHHDFSILFGSGLMKSGQATWMHCHSNRFFTFELTDAQAAKLQLKPGGTAVNFGGFPFKRQEEMPEVEIGMPVLDAKGVIDLNQSVTGHEAMRTRKSLYDSGEDFAFRLTYFTPKKSVTLMQHLAAPPLMDGKNYPLKFGVDQPRLDYSGPMVLFFDFCKVDPNTQSDLNQTIISPTTFGVLVDVESSNK